MENFARNLAIPENSGVGAQADLEITANGSDWYYTVCCIMGVSSLLFILQGFRTPQGAGRLFPFITAIITIVATVAYYSMGSNLGQVPILAEFIRPNDPQTSHAGTREIFYARYIDWAITTPLLLTDLLLTSGAPWPTLVIAILADEVMVVTGLVGALTKTAYKWGYFGFGMMALFLVCWALAMDGLRHAKAIGGSVYRTYMGCGVLTLFLWFLYPIAWGLCEGGNVIHPDSEAIFYGVLDVFAKPVFGFMLLYGHSKIDPATIGLGTRTTDEDRKREHFDGRDGPLDAPRAGNNGVHEPVANNGTSTV